jgi:glutamate-ammonia-ligase adenylyltransferase
MRLRPTGRSGSLVTPLAGFRRYFAAGQAEGGAQLWERQALTRARVVYGNADFGKEVQEALEEAAYGLPWRRELADEILAMRERLEGSRGQRNLKRGFGGLADVEFLVQLFQLKYGRSVPALRTPNTWEALDALGAAGFLTGPEAATLREGQNFLLGVQSRLRAMHNRSLDEVPAAEEEVEKLARHLGFESGHRFLAELERYTTQIRELFLRLTARERG